MSFAASLPAVQDYFTRYGMTTYSISGIWGLNVSAVPLIWGLDHASPFLYNQFACGMFFYFRHSFNQMLRTFFVLVCADRYACCSDRQKVRAFRQYKVAIRVIPAVWIFWFLLLIFPTLLRTLYNGVCDSRSGVDDIIYTVYIISTTGIVPLGSMIIFGILMIRSLRQMRRRIVPSMSSEPGGNILRKCDRDMLRMLLIELVICTITLSPNTFTHIYKSATTNVIKSKDRQQIETFVYYIARLFLLYLANAFSFWVYVSTSQTYRLELKNLFIKWYKFFIRN
ncbi:unnamed protein product [Adineta steineri]|uniref:G-protein coupled receptors family 1 profile domain-containing protein n=1 Tax=Adineta steineri TaxID=433720 RepID=A0A819DQM5_9BILA|nr:unnamed protein product [Adineta steineri]CAF3833833.1 unnamed protein product [Adineta steineri]